MSKNMPKEIPSLETRLARHTAEAFWMPAQCSRRACRRTGCCQGSVSATGEPSCIERLAPSTRNLFASHAALVRTCADLIRAGKPPTPLKESGQAYAFALCLRVAFRALADLPANRGPLRQRLRRFKLAPLGRPPRGSVIAYETFGTSTDREPAAASGEEPAQRLFPHQNAEGARP